MIPPPGDRGPVWRAWTALAEDAVPTGTCPDPDRLWLAVHGELPAAETRALVGHVAGCGACAEAWRLARDLAREDPGGAYDTRPARYGSTGWRGGWGTLAATVAAVALASAVLLDRGPRSPVYRSGEPVATRRLVPEHRPLPRSAFVLRWTPGPAGSRYDVHVATEDLTTLVHARGLATPEYAVPEAALVTVPAGGRVLWRVETLLPDGRRAGSPTFRARVQ